MKTIDMFLMHLSDSRYYLAQNKTLTIDNVFVNIGTTVMTYLYMQI